MIDERIVIDTNRLLQIVPSESVYPLYLGDCGRWLLFTLL